MGGQVTLDPVSLPAHTEGAFWGLPMAKYPLLGAAPPHPALCYTLGQVCVCGGGVGF